MSALARARPPAGGRTPAPGPEPLRLARLLPPAAGVSVLFFCGRLLVWGARAWPYPALLLFLCGGFALGRQ